MIIIGDGSDITTWSAVETSVGLICASVPPLKPLYRLLRCRTLSTVNGYSDVYDRRTHPYSNQNPQDNPRGTQRRGVHITHEFGTRADIESTTDLVAPTSVSSQSYAMTVTTVSAKFWQLIDPSSRPSLIK